MRTFEPKQNDIPGPIVQGICAVQLGLDGAVRKSQRNQQGGYMFASTDDIYASVTKLMGEAGLSVICLENSCEIKRFEQEKNGEKKTVQWGHFEFSFVLASADGSTWQHPSLKRTVYVQILGAQTFQAAQSYAEKAFLRSLFKLPTGDMDLDSMPQGESEEDQISLSQPRKRKSSSAAKKDGTDSVFENIRREIANAKSRHDLIALRTTYADDWGQMPMRWDEIIENEYEDKLLGFGTREAAE
jgi:hypothetical protein